MRAGAAAFVVAVVVAMMAAAGVTANDAPIVDTEGGRVSGIVEESFKGREFYSFYGIPFAQPPVGKLRFKDPKTSLSWGGIRDGSTPPSLCPQYHFLERKNILGEEDCLYLNVFTPKVTGKENLPVMVWIHGGAFISGSALEYRPHVLLDHDVVLVTMQYRLGILGFLTTEDSVMPGNLGLKDQTMALQWVQRNIHHFGGDKKRVTIFGVSAGAASVHYQILTPKAEGLFSRAIMQSGAALCPWALNKNPRKVALQVAGSLGCPTDQGSHDILDCLQGIDTNNFVTLHNAFSKWNSMPLLFTPWVDGHYLPAHPAQLVREGRHAQVDIVSGVNRDEGALFVLPILQRKTLLEGLQNNFSVTGPASLSFSDDLSEDPVALATQVYLHYLGTTHVTEEHAESLKIMQGDLHFTVCHDLTTAYHTADKIFRYELQHKAELSQTHFLCPSCYKEWVSHSDDLFYLFLGGPVLIPPSEGLKDLQRPDDLALRDIFTTLWTNFAATGNPTPDDSLGFKWEPSRADNLHYLSLTPSPSMQPDNREEVRKFYNSLPLIDNLILHPHLVEGGRAEPRDAEDASKTEL